MKENEGYAFCPECGALMKDGACAACGKGKEKQPDGMGMQENAPCFQPGYDPAQPGQGGAQPGYGFQGGYGYQQGSTPQSGYEYQQGSIPQSGYGYRQGPTPQPGYGYRQGSNGDPQGPGGQFGYGPQNGFGGRMEPDRNRKHMVTALLVTVIAVLLCIVFVLVFLLARGAMKEAMGGGIGKGYPGGYEDVLPPDYGAEDPFLYELPEEREPEEAKEPYVPSAEDDYYVELADAVRDDLSYQIEWEEYDYVDDKTGATAVGKYPRLVGGTIPHADELNERIEEEATYYSDLYAYYKEWQEGENLSYASESMGYVTYMDEERISIVFQERFFMDMESSVSLYSINIDLVSGEILDNGSVIEYSPELAEVFRNQNEYQNGAVEAVDSMSDEELLDFLSDPDTNIVFFTPVGLEIGFNYTTSDSTGWVSATLKDYSRFTKKF